MLYDKWIKEDEEEEMKNKLAHAAGMALAITLCGFFLWAVFA